MRSSGIKLKKVILSGGASKNRPLCQIISDVLQEKVEVFVEAEASSRGVFLLARDEDDWYLLTRLSQAEVREKLSQL